MHADPFPSGTEADPSGGTAMIPEVTDEMMDHAAHLAAELADGVAHGTIARADAATETVREFVEPETGAQDTDPQGTDPQDTGAQETGEPQDGSAMAGPEADTPVESAAEPQAEVAEALGPSALDVAAESLAAARVSVERAVEATPSGERVGTDPRDAGEATSRGTDMGPPDAADAFERYNAKVFEMVRTNMAATGAHMAALMQAKSVPEAMTLNADHLRRQLDAMTAQARELTTLARTLTFDALQPLKGVIAPDR